MNRKTAQRICKEINGLDSGCRAVIVEVKTLYHPDFPCAIRVDRAGNEVGFAGRAREAQYLADRIKSQCATVAG